MGKLINRIPGSRLLISSLPGSALTSLAMSTCILKALPGKNDIKIHSTSILYLYVWNHLAQERSVGSLLPKSAMGWSVVTVTLPGHIYFFIFAYMLRLETGLSPPVKF